MKLLDRFRWWRARPPVLAPISEKLATQLIEGVDADNAEDCADLNRALDEAQFPSEQLRASAQAAIEGFKFRRRLAGARDRVRKDIAALEQAGENPETILLALLRLAKGYGPEAYDTAIREELEIEFRLSLYLAKLPEAAQLCYEDLCRRAPDSPIATCSLYALCNGQDDFHGLSNLLVAGPPKLPADWDSLVAFHWNDLCDLPSSKSHPTLEWFRDPGKKVLDQLSFRRGGLRRHVVHLSKQSDLVEVVRFLAWWDSHAERSHLSDTLVRLELHASDLRDAERERRGRLAAS